MNSQKKMDELMMIGYGVRQQITAELYQKPSFISRRKSFSLLSYAMHFISTLIPNKKLKFLLGMLSRII